MNKDYYSILGVQPGASTDEIKKAYHKKARELHPDLNPSAPLTRIQEVNEAYDVLSSKRRSIYDHERKPATQQDYPSNGFDPSLYVDKWHKESKYYKTHITKEQPNWMKAEEERLAKEFAKKEDIRSSIGNIFKKTKPKGK